MDSAEQNKPTHRTHSKGRAALFIFLAVFLLATITCLLLFAIWPRLNQPKEPIDLQELPQIQVAKHIIMCPNGTIPPFEFKATDSKDGDITKNVEIKPTLGGAMIKATDSDGHEVSQFIPAEIKDTAAPVINLNGDSSYVVLVGNPLTVPAATATDNCDGEIAVETSGAYDVNTAGNYMLEYTATDSSGNTTTARRDVNVTTNSGIIYLTFDDGPGPYTERLLDILKQYNVKATFFVTAAGSDATLKREFDEGHAIGLHSFSHSYADIYRSPDAYFNDLALINQRVQNVTGQATHLLRFPGGTSNTISRNYDGGTRIMSQLVNMVKERGYTYFDWNLSSGDAGSVYTADAVYNTVVTRLAPNQNWVILQHDIKDFSVDAVERIIQYGKAQGFTFKKLDEDSFTAAHGVLN